VAARRRCSEREAEHVAAGVEWEWAGGRFVRGRRGEFQGTWCARGGREGAAAAAGGGLSEAVRAVFGAGERDAQPAAGEEAARRRLPRQHRGDCARERSRFGLDLRGSSFGGCLFSVSIRGEFGSRH